MSGKTLSCSVESLEGRAMFSATASGPQLELTADGTSYWQVAADAQGNTVAVWQAYHDGTPHVYARRFDPTGLPRGAAVQVDAAGAYANGSAAPDVAVNAAGSFIVTWDQVDQGKAKEGWNIHARRYDAAGAPLSGDFTVTQSAANSQNRPTAAIDDAGDFVVAWMTSTGTIVQRYTASGAKAGKAFQASGSSGGSYPSAAMDRAGNFAIAWQDSDGSGSGIAARRYSAAGAALGAAFRVNATTAGDQQFPEIAMDAAGDFIVCWSGGGTYARRFAAAGAAGSELAVGAGNAGSVSMDRDGNAVVDWVETNADHTHRSMPSAICRPTAFW
jgi:hypothetical protein